MSKTVFPAKMAPILPFLRGVEVMGDPTPKLADDDTQKKSGDLLQWAISVIVPQGRLLTERRVTLLSKTRPGVRDGQVVIFPDLHVGAYSSSGAGAGLYFWATDVRAAAASEGSDD